jgi:hypothetical protein
MASRPIYQFYAELDYFTPKIWRRFQVTENITVARLGYIVQVLFEMTASHLMAIEVPVGENYTAFLKAGNLDMSYISTVFGVEPDLVCRYEIPFDDMEFYEYINRNVSVNDATKTPMKYAVSLANSKLLFFYDFGDGWQVSLVLEKIYKDENLPGKELPRVLEGANFGIVEDVGGTEGLTELVKASKKKKGTNYKEYVEWLGIKDFDITAFDLDDMNFRLKKIPRIYKDSYESECLPTQKSIDLIERKYLKKS